MPGGLQQAGRLSRLERITPEHAYLDLLPKLAEAA
jgi:hypothetical protein